MNEDNPKFRISERTRVALFTDFDGQPADVDDVIADALDDRRYEQRELALIEILGDPDAGEYETFLAVCALVEWGSAAGYVEVVRAVESSTTADVRWRGVSVDRHFSVDNTLAQMATATANSLDIARERGTVPQRFEAMKALISVADREFLEDGIHWVLDAGVVGDLRDLIANVTNEGVTRLENGEHFGFDMALQMAFMVEGLARTNSAWVGDFAQRLRALPLSTTAQKVLTSVDL